MFRHPFFIFINVNKFKIILFNKCNFLLMLIMKYITVCQKYIRFNKLSTPVQQLISGVVILSEIWIKRFEDRQMGTIRSAV